MPVLKVYLVFFRMRHDNPLEKATEFFEGPTSMKIVCENAKNDPMLVGPEGNGILDDINPEKLSKSPSSRLFSTVSSNHPSFRDM